MREIVGVDLGATNFKAGLVRNGVIVSESFNPVSRDDSETKLFEILFKTLDAVITKNVKRIGVGVPGVVDPHSGVIYDIQNLPKWKEVPLKSILEARYKATVFLNNDANCFAQGEKIFGSGKTYTNFVGLTIGTGLGMGIILNNQLYNGVLCGAGEIGMVTYKDSILEEYASSLFFDKKFGQNAEELSCLGFQGDSKALEAFSEFGIHIGNAIHNILYMYAPEAIIIGGAISKSYSLFKKSTEDTLKLFAYPKQIEHLKIEVSSMRGIAILGAASLCVE